MAIWQVTFKLAPKTHFPADHSTAGEKLLAVLAEGIPVFRDFTLADDYVADVSRLLPPNMGWTEKMEYWGAHETDDFEIWRDQDGQIESIQARIDVRKLDDALLAGLLDLADRWKCVLVEERHHTVCRMTATELRGFIAGHAHSRAMKDPNTWLPFLSDETKQRPPGAG